MEQFLLYLQQWLPASVVTIIGTFLTLFLPKLVSNLIEKSCKHNDDEIKELQKSCLLLIENQKNLQTQIGEVLKENAELKAENKELKQLITHVKED